jgi:hypothetical protein
MCRKELVEVMEDSEDEDEEEYSDDEEDDELEYEVGTPPTAFQFTQALKKKGYTEVDFMQLILNKFYDYNWISGRLTNEIEECEEKDNELMTMITEIMIKKKSVDYRDKRSYADVLLGKEKIGETGIGPTSVYHTDN